MNLQKILIVDGDPSVLLDLVGFLSDTSYELMLRSCSFILVYSPYGQTPVRII